MAPGGPEGLVVLNRNTEVMLLPSHLSDCLLRKVTLSALLAVTVVTGPKAAAAPANPVAQLPLATMPTPPVSSAPVASGSAQSSATPADRAWFALRDQHKAAAQSRVTKLKGDVAANREEATKVKNEREARAQKFRQTAQTAQDFYLQHPNDPKAAAARKLEALAGLEGITPTDRTHERAALATAAAFRTNRSHPVSARFEVAHAMERRAASKKILGRPWFSHPAVGEMMLDALHAEFGELPEIYGSFLALAEHSNCDNGRDVALRIVQAPAPESIKISARRLLERYALVRQPLDFPLTPLAGRATTLGQLAGKLTVVCFWDSTRYPAGPPGLHDYKKNPEPNTKWIYVSMGSPAALPKGAKPLPAPPGTTWIEPLGLKSPLATQLRLTQLPFVLVLDEKKQLSGYGRLDELPWLLAGTNRLIAP